MVERLPQPVRWILVLPAAIVAYIAVQVLIIVLGAISGFLNEGGWPNWLYQLVNSAAGPYASVAAAAWIAPRAKFPTSVVIGVLNVLLALALILEALSKAAEQSDTWLLLALAGVLGVASSGFACYQVRLEQRGTIDLAVQSEFPE